MPSAYLGMKIETNRRFTLWIGNEGETNLIRSRSVQEKKRSLYLGLRDILYNEEFDPGSG